MLPIVILIGLGLAMLYMYHKSEKDCGREGIPTLGPALEDAVAAITTPDQPPPPKEVQPQFTTTPKVVITPHLKMTRVGSHKNSHGHRKKKKEDPESKKHKEKKEKKEKRKSAETEGSHTALNPSETPDPMPSSPVALPPAPSPPNSS